MNTPDLITTLRSDCLCNIDQIFLCVLEVDLGSSDGVRWFGKPVGRTVGFSQGRADTGCNF